MSKYKRVDTYHKLVRDRIPEIIEADDLIAETKILTNKEAILELRKKLIEEAGEVIESDDVDDLVIELADLKEVEIALMKRFKIDPEIVEKVCLERREKRGSFDKGVYLIGTKEK